MEYTPQLHPFESPIEEELAAILGKYLSESAIFENQVVVPTPNGEFRLDFLVTAEGRKVGIEADGREFHSYARDMFRDAVILGYSDVEAIYRLRGRDIHSRLEDALYAISAVEPTLFSERGRMNLQRLSTVSESLGRLRIVSEIIIGEGEDPSSRAVWIQHLSKSMENPIWRRLAEFARGYPRLSVAELVLRADECGLRWYSEPSNSPA